MALTSIKI